MSTRIRVTIPNWWDEMEADNGNEYDAERVSDGGSFHGYYETKFFIFQASEVDVVK